MLKNKNAVSYIHILSAILALILMLVGMKTKGLTNDTFSGTIIAMLLLGVVTSILAFVLDKMDWLDIIPIVFYGFSLGLIFKDGVEVVAYGVIGIDNNTGGNLMLTGTYLAIGAVLLVISIIKAFIYKDRE